jgi:hypothetical protein
MKYFMTHLVHSSNIEHIDQDLHVAENVITLAFKVVLHECFLAAGMRRDRNKFKLVTTKWAMLSEWRQPVLPSTIPKVEHQISQETNVGMFHIHYKRDPTPVFNKNKNKNMRNRIFTEQEQKKSIILT